MKETSSDGQRDLVGHMRTMADLRSSAGAKNDDLAYSSIEAFVLERGQSWTHVAMPKGIYLGAEKECFSNAYQMADGRGLRYVEGYALRVIPVHHAWCVDASGTVVDPTWKYGGVAYFGMEFDLPTVRAARTDHNVSVLADWPHGFPLLRKPLV